MYVRRYLHLPSLAVGGIILYIRHMIGVAFGKRVSPTLSTRLGTTNLLTDYCIS